MTKRGFQKGHTGFRDRESYENQKNAVPSILRKCESCAKKFYWKPYKNKGRFCSRGCINLRKENNPNWQGGKTGTYQSIKGRNPKKWKEWREEVFSRDGYMCLVCGAKGSKGAKLDPHHIHKVRTHPHLVYETWNGITVCRSCHRLVENKRETKDIYGIAELAMEKIYKLVDERTK